MKCKSIRNREIFAIRGGGFGGVAAGVRVANRDWVTPGSSWDDLGFRIVKEK